MALDLRGRPILITGASSGIGAAAARACARAGMPVMLAARRVERIEELAKEIRDGGGRAAAFRLDVRDAAACAEAVRACVREFGSIYAVFANAGYGEEVGAYDQSEESLREIFEVNFFGTMHTIRPAIAEMLKKPFDPRQPRGHVLICSSCLARLPLPYYGAYSATKAAQHHIARALRLEMEDKGIAVSSVHPIGTKTEFFQTVESRAEVAKLVSHSPEFLMQSAEYVGRQVVKGMRHRGLEVILAPGGIPIKLRLSPRPEIWPGPMGLFVRFGMSVLVMWPRLADWSLRGMVKRRIEHHDARAERARARMASAPSGREKPANMP